MYRGNLSVRKRLLLNNLIMVLVPVILLVSVGSAAFYGLRTTGNFREREIELLWPEEGSAVPVQLGLSHLRTHVDWHWKEGASASRKSKLGKYFTTMEQMGIRIAVLDQGRVTYETEPGTARAVVKETYQRAPGPGNAFIWDQQGLTFRYMSEEHQVVTAASGPVPFRVTRGYFPETIEKILKYFATGFCLLAAVLIILTGMILARHLSRKIIGPLEELQQSARSIRGGDYETPVRIHGDDELGETAAAFEQMRVQLRVDRHLRETYEQNRRELLAGIAHDLATPLTKIQGYTEGILDGIANTPEKQRHYLTLVHRTSRQMQALVQDLFFFSKLELGAQELFKWEIIDLSLYLQKYVDNQAEILAAQDFELHLENHRPAGFSFVRMDQTQFRRVLDNILSNAVKYRNKDKASLCLQLTEEGENQCLLLRCMDNGSGVEPQEMRRLFDSFYRTDKARSNVAKGSGLGLAITRRIVEEMGGSIWAEANLPQGLVICIQLPLTTDTAGGKTP